MSDSVEKVYCMDNPSSSTELAALSNNNQWMNNPFMYLVWLAILGKNGLYGGSDSTQISELSSRLDSLNNQISSNQNTNLMMDAINGNHEALHTISAALGVDFATIQGAISGVQNAITLVGGQVGMTGQQVINSVLLGNKDLTQALQTCCCENKLLVTTMGYEGLIRDILNSNNIVTRIDQLSNGITLGFSQVGYAAQLHANDIIQSGNMNTLRIVDTLNNHWQAETSQSLQDAKFEISQLKQTQYLANQFNGITNQGSIWS